MKLLITGGCGFLGSNLAAHAIGQGIELCVFDNLSRNGSRDNLEWLQGQGGFDFRHGDIRNANDVDVLLRDFRPDHVFHLAGQVAMTTSIADPRRDFEINAFGTLNVLEALRRHSPEATICYSSTNKVYGDLEQYVYEETATRWRCVDRPQGFDERTPLDFHSPYGCSKGTADQYLLDYARMFGVHATVFRHSSMYGGRQFATADQGWVGWFCKMAWGTRTGHVQSFDISGSGKQVRDVLHADDMTRLYFGALECSDAVRGHAYNIGGGMANSLSLLELFELLEEFTGVRLRYDKLAPRSSDQRVFVADIGLAERSIGWTPQVSARDGVRRMVEWTAEHARLG
jgi:CDP-paratose 2-epimerase